MTTHKCLLAYTPKKIKIWNKIIYVMWGQWLHLQIQNLYWQRKSSSTSTCTLSLRESCDWSHWTWKSAVDRKELVYILTTDTSKAFDSLCHPLIVKKLEVYGFGQNSLNLLRSYFDNRLNRVKKKDVTSDWKRMVLGCPQGSSFSPLLWNLFQNDVIPYKSWGRSTT